MLVNHTICIEKFKLRTLKKSSSLWIATKKKSFLSSANFPLTKTYHFTFKMTVIAFNSAKLLKSRKLEDITRTTNGNLKVDFYLNFHQEHLSVNINGLHHTHKNFFLFFHQKEKPLDHQILNKKENSSLFFIIKLCNNLLIFNGVFSIKIWKW